MFRPAETPDDWVITCRFTDQKGEAKVATMNVAPLARSDQNWQAFSEEHAIECAVRSIPWGKEKIGDHVYTIYLVFRRSCIKDIQARRRSEIERRMKTERPRTISKVIDRWLKRQQESYATSR